MTWDAVDAWWWPYVFILLAGALPTYAFRALGVVFGGRMREDSEFLVLVRAIATALVAAVIAQLVLRPTGSLADFPLWLRLGATVAGFGTFLFIHRSTLTAVIVAEAILVGGYLLQ